MGNGDYKPLLYSLAIIFVIGAIFTIVVNSFEEVIPEPTGATKIFTDVIDNQKNITITSPYSFVVNAINPINFLSVLIPDSLYDLVKNDVRAFALIPEQIRIPLIIMLIIGLVWGVVKIFPFS